MTAFAWCNIGHLRAPVRGPNLIVYLSTCQATSYSSHNPGLIWVIGAQNDSYLISAIRGTVHVYVPSMISSHSICAELQEWVSEEDVYL